MQLADHAHDPGKVALVDVASGVPTTFAELDDRSRRLADALAARGLGPGGHLAILMVNEPGYYDVAWAAQRSGLLYTPINWHLTPDEAAYIVDNCDATVLVASAALAELAAAVVARCPKLEALVAVGGDIEGFEPLDALFARVEGTVSAVAIEGSPMYYSSGTTGRPKGVLRPWPGVPYGEGLPLDLLQARWFEFDATTVLLSPAPLYHAAPLGWSMGCQRLGGTAILVPRFDAEQLLALVEQHRITHLQLVPTMFVRLLRLPAEVRTAYDLSSLCMVIHAAAPCPADVKDAMLDWFGPVIREYYSGSEANGFCTIGPDEARERRGSVGRPVSGSVHVLDEAGRELPPGEVGTIFFAGTASFEYYKDPEGTAAAFDDRGWSTLGDMGYVDDDGYVYLTDRRSHMIISGGVNIYPQEVENLLALHPAVEDVAVIGVPHAEMGEEVKAVVQSRDPGRAGPELEAELIAYCREHLAHFKCPRSVDFDDHLPRTPAGKLAKGPIRKRYLDAAGAASPTGA